MQDLAELDNELQHYTKYDLKTQYDLTKSLIKLNNQFKERLRQNFI